MSSVLPSGQLYRTRIVTLETDGNVWIMQNPPSHVTIKIWKGPQLSDLSDATLQVLSLVMNRPPLEIRGTLDGGAIKLSQVPVTQRLVQLLKKLKEGGLEVRTYASGSASRPDESSKDTGEDESAADWRKGDVIGGLYEVLGSAEGGMGRVYFVFHRQWKMMMAIKTPLPQKVKTEASVLRFLREAELWVNLGLHPNIAVCYYARVINGLPRLFIEFVDGGSLDRWIDDDRLGNPALVTDLMIQFCHGMIHAQEMGLVHRDIKPANCLMTRDGTLKITDFGLVKRIEEASIEPNEEMPELKKIQHADVTVIEGGVRGSPWWMAPERFRAKAVADVRSEIYSFGVMMYEAAVGHMPFQFPDGYSLKALVQKHLKAEPTDPRTFRPDLPQTMVDIIRTALEKKPENRYSSFAELCEALELLGREISPDRPPRERPDILALKADSLNNQAVSLFDLGRDDEAMSLLEDALSVNPEHLETVYNLHGRRWIQGKASDQEIVSSMESLQIEVRETDNYHRLMGMISLQRGDPVRGIARLQKAFERNPQYKARWAGRGEDPASFLESQGLTAIEERAQFAGHLKSIRSLAFSPDSKKAFSVGQDRSIRIWDVNTCRCLRNLRTFTFVPVAGAFSSDGKFGATSYGEAFKTMDLWDLETGRLVKKFSGMAVTGLRFSDDSRLLAGYGTDGSIRIWDISSESVVWDWRDFSGEISCLDFLPGAKSLIIGCTAGSLALVVTGSGRILWQCSAHEGPVRCLEVGDEGNLIVSGGVDETIRLRETSSGKELKKLSGHRGAVVSLRLVPDSDYMVSCSADGAIKVWDLADSRCYRTVELTGEELTECALSGDGKSIIAGGAKGAVREFSLDTNWFSRDFLEPAISRPPTFKELAGLHASFQSAVQGFNKAWRNSEHREAAGCFEKVRSTPGFRWSKEAVLMRNVLKSSFDYSSLMQSSFIRAFRGHQDAVVAVNGSEDSLQLLTGSTDGTAAIWDVVSGRCTRWLEVGSPVVGVLFISRSRNIITWSRDGVLRKWDLEGEKLFEVEDVQGPVQVQDDGRILIAMSPLNRPLTIDMETGGKTVLGGEIPGPHFQCFSSDGDMAYSLRDGLRIQRWEIKTGLSKGAFRDLGVPITSLRPYLSDDRVAAGMETGDLMVYMVGSGVNVLTLKGHASAIRVLAAGPGDTHWITGSDDCTMRVWDLTQEKCVTVLEGHSAPLRAACFLGNGSMIASGGSDGSTRLWGLEWELSQKQH
jgi:WD40 repeat protein/serine/threonine protein kinase